MVLCYVDPYARFQMRIVLNPRESFASSKLKHAYRVLRAALAKCKVREVVWKLLTYLSVSISVYDNDLGVLRSHPR